MWFVYDPEGIGYKEYETEAEAKAMAEKRLKHWQIDAENEGEWFDDGLPYLRWGKILGAGKLVDRDGEDCADGILAEY